MELGMTRPSAFLSGVAAAWEGMKRHREPLSRLGRLWTTQQWYLMCAETNSGTADTSTFKPLNPPPNAFWADPFVVVRESRCFVFFEQFHYQFWGRTRGGKGTIAAMERFPDGTWGEPALVLERDYHLSYPFVFQWQDRFYLLPETAENRTIELYEEVEFPWKWRFCRTIMHGVSALDTTLHQADGRWWMFTCVQTDGVANRDLYLFSSPDPVGGDWEPHPSNPIVSDRRCARPAGGIFFDGHHWIRPSQDCSRDYGRAVEFRRIVRLDQNAYAEEPAGRFGPEEFVGAAGVHTWNSARGLQMADARRSIPRWHLSWGNIRMRVFVTRGAIYAVYPWLSDLAQPGFC
jgi:hypothetical protein